MCGIAGIVLKKKTEAHLIDAFEQSTQLMNHRGPDYFGKYVKDNVALFHYRLSILDLDARSNQPFGDVVKEGRLIYNGELYNFKNLKEKYKIKQETTSDTEVLFKLLQLYNTNILPELNGIFAFSYLNVEKNTLMICRDRFGVKPLYYFETDDFFVFASEAKVILKFIKSFEVDFQALTEYLWYGSSITEQTIVKGIKKIEAGTYLSIDLSNNSTSSKSYWSIEKNILPIKNTDSYTTALNKTKNLFDAGVKRQCMSDVPVGAYLSGGVDSSAVVAFASRYTNGKLNTYSAEFDFVEGKGSELPEAKRIAKKYGTTHHEFRVETNHLEDDIPSIIFQYDEPFADPAALPLHLMAKTCRGMSKVVLQGDGGDELFAGYGRHLDFSELKLRQVGSAILSRIHPSANYRKLMAYRSGILNQSNAAHRMAQLVANAGKGHPELMFNNEWNEQIKKANPFMVYEKKNKKFSSLPYMQRMLYTDMEVILAHTFLDKVDKINMLHSIEARVPFLDNDLVTYVMSLPHQYKIKNRTTKSFLREVLSNEIPKDILYMQKKSFGTPISSWLKTTLYPFAKKTFESALAQYQFINTNFLLAKLEEHKLEKFDHAALLWRAIVLIVWLNFYKEKIIIS